MVKKISVKGVFAGIVLLLTMNLTAQNSIFSLYTGAQVGVSQIDGDRSTGFHKISYALRIGVETRLSGRFYLDNAIGYSNYGAQAGINRNQKINSFDLTLYTAFKRLGLVHAFNEDYDGNFQSKISSGVILHFIFKDKLNAPNTTDQLFSLREILPDVKNKQFNYYIAYHKRINVQFSANIEFNYAVSSIYKSELAASPIQTLHPFSLLGGITFHL